MGRLSDPVLPFSVGERVSERLGMATATPRRRRRPFLQGDAGPQLGARIAERLRA